MVLLPKFYVPPTLKQDFDNFLSSDVPDQVRDVQLIKDWYAIESEDYTPTIIRAEIYPDSSKSRYINTDLSLNVRFSKDADVKQGDYIKVDDDIFILNWHVFKMSNNKPSRLQYCNTRLTFTKFQDAIVDNRGLITQPAGRVNIAENIPANVYRYDGRPEWSVNRSAPGVNADAQTMLCIQYNQKTANIRAWDQFIWGGVEYVVADVHYTGMNPNLNDGMLSLQAKKKAGGVIE